MTLFEGNVLNGVTEAVFVNTCAPGDASMDLNDRELIDKLFCVCQVGACRFLEAVRLVFIFIEAITSKGKVALRSEEELSRQSLSLNRGKSLS